MFTLDTESGFDKVVFITASYGLGETVVQGAVNPDEFYVFKPTLDEGKFPIIRKSLGSKLIRMEFETDASTGRMKLKFILFTTAARSVRSMFLRKTAASSRSPTTT